MSMMDDLPLYLYLSAQSVSAAVDRLGASRAKSSLGAYLVFKRALVIHRMQASNEGIPPPNSIVTGTASVAFVQAHIDVGLCYVPEKVNELVGGNTISESLSTLAGSSQNSKALMSTHPWLERPFFVPFGAGRDTGKGYRKAKWPSNGPSDTVDRWQSQTKKPLVYVPATSPKEYVFEALEERDLEKLFNIGQSRPTLEKPDLVDAAIWWFRFADLAQRFQHEPSEDELQAAFIDDLDLTDREINAVFAEPTVPEAPELTLGGEE